MNDLSACRKSFDLGSGREGVLYSLPALERAGLGGVPRMPVCLRIVLESLLRNLDGKRVSEADVRALASWSAKADRTAEVPFVVARVLLQDFTGVPLVVDLAAMRSAVARLGGDPLVVQPQVPVDLVIDHSVQVDHAGRADALTLNMQLEFTRNRARYEFLKWGMQAFDGLRIVPPGIGIVHQVNLEYLAQVVVERDGVFFPDSLVGTDSHTPMVNGLGVVGWGVGGIEAEAGMLGQPVYFLTPDVVGVHLKGTLPEGATATDAVLTIVQMLRKANVVGKFVEFFGAGAASLPVTERATIANMAPEYGATMGYFPVDEATLKYLAMTGRSAEKVEAVRRYYEAQGLFGIPSAGQCDYTTTLELDLSTVQPSVAGPRRPQDRIEMRELGSKFRELLTRTDATGFGRLPTEIDKRAKGPTLEIGTGDVVIAAITSCTNTSNPSVMVAAGILAKKAVEKGLKVRSTVKTSLAPGSRVVTRYLEKTGLQRYLDLVGFQTVGYGCTTCIGNSGPLSAEIEELVTKNDVVVASVLSGNRNFEARVHQSVKANFLMSPPLVVAFALAGRVTIDLSKEPIGLGKDGKPVYLRDLWPTRAEMDAAMSAASDPAAYRELYAPESMKNQFWDEVPAPTGTLYAWDAESTYIQEAPFFTPFERTPTHPTDIVGARPLALFGDSVTTDHISPAGNIKATSPAGLHLVERGVAKEDFNSYGARRGNHHVMMRGTFANVRIKNLMVPGVEGGVTVHRPGGERMTIYDAAMRYQADQTPTVILAGAEYGSGSSRDWAAKGPLLLGVRAVVATSFERIHRSNLVFMGVLPCQFRAGAGIASLGLDGTETYDLVGIAGGVRPRMEATLVVHRASGKTEEVPVVVRIDTPIEADYYAHGGILPYVLRKLIGS